MSHQSSRSGLISGLLSFLVMTPATAQGPSAAIDGIRFELAEGLRIEKVADEPLVKWPIVADWDPEGRLVIAESGGVGWPIQEHNQKELHQIIRLQDVDGDGKYDKRIIAADRLAFPEGVLCLGNAIFVSAPPVIWKLADLDDDGVCEQREVWFDGGTVTNCANDLHGPYLGRDGWIYWCKGAFGEQKHVTIDGRTLQSSAAQIYRRRPTGGPIEFITSGGMDNPVEVAMTPEGEKFFTSTFLQHPGNGLRDGIAHAVYGSVFGKDHSVLDGLTRTGTLMPIMTQLGPAAPSGLICLESERIVPRSNQSRSLVSASFNLQKLSAHRLFPNGASYRSVDHDLVVADRIDFHPTDVLEDADGSLLLIDTGGWYDLCCPTSRINQKTASGGIYRVFNEATLASRKEPFAHQNRRSLEEVIPLLFDKRPWVRRRATSLVQQFGSDAVTRLEAILSDGNRSVDDRLTALWTLCGIGTGKALQAITSQLRSTEVSLIHAACHAVSVERYAPAREAIELLLQHDQRSIRRAAAEAIGRIGTRISQAKLMDAVEHTEDDRHLEHSLLYAMIEIARREKDLVRIESTDVVSERRLHAALVVIEQLGQSNDLKPNQLFQAMQSDDAKLREKAIDIISRNSDWASSSTEEIERLWSRVPADQDAAVALPRILERWNDDASIRGLIQKWLTSAAKLDQNKQHYLAQNLARFSQRTLPREWSEVVIDWLRSADAQTQILLALSLGKLKVEPSERASITSAIIDLADRAESPTQRLQLLLGIPRSQRISRDALEATLISEFLQGDDLMMALAADVLIRTTLSNDGAADIVDALPKVSSQFLTTAIESVHRSQINSLDEKLLMRLKALPTARTLPDGYLENLFKDRPVAIRELAKQTAADLIRPPANVQASVEEMLARLLPGDPVRGLQVFRGNKAACSGCHRMGYIGKEIGPALTKIGGSRTRAALLEAVLFPNARLEQSYQTTRILTADGQVYNGLVRRRTNNSVEMVLNAQRTVSIANEDIERSEPSDVSVMPSGLQELLSLQELSDLMALLQSAK